MSTPDVPQKAMQAAMDACLEWLDQHEKSDFSQFTVDDANSFFGTFIDTYTFEIAKSWDPKLIKMIGVPARG